MSSKTASIDNVITFKNYRWSQSVIGRFVARRTIITAAFWALLFGALVASKSAGYAAAYPSAVARAKLAVSFSNNVGLNALFGAPHAVNTVSGFTVWNTLNVMVIVGAIWGFLTATKVFRGEEDSGRWELLLTGQTTARRACVNALAGLAAGLLAMYFVAACAFLIVGRIHSVDFSSRAGLFFALAAICGATMFTAFGALASELMPTRSQAGGLSVAVFGVFFVIRAVADITTMHWLLWVTPLGWIEKLQPLYGSRPIWLIPIAAFISLLVGLTIMFSKRDLGDSTFAERNTPKPHTKFLNTPIELSLRLARNKIIGWLAAVALGATFFGLLTKSASSAFAQSATLEQRLKDITHAQTTGALIFLGVVFYLLMMLIMALVANGVSGMRDEEAEGYLDNLVVRKVSRLAWLSGRLLIVGATILIAGLLATACVAFGLINQSLGLSLHELVMAGLNTIIPSVFVLGVGIFSLGFLPRLTSVLTYGIIAWSFLISIVSSGINLNHWIADTSILQHMALAPASSPTWRTNFMIIGISLLLIVVGAVRFNSRDLQGE